MTQNETILYHLRFIGKITQAEAIDLYGIYRLSARVYDLRARGWPIESIQKKGRNRYGKPTRYDEYMLKSKEKGIA